MLFKGVRMKLSKVSPYHAKDQAKSDKATQFIGLGSVGSSTDVYRKDWQDKANTGEYTSEDVVFVSINGNKHNRIPFSAIKHLVDKAIITGVTFITDNSYHRNRRYNIGEREVANYLSSNGYKETNGNGIWKPQ